MYTLCGLDLSDLGDIEIFPDGDHLHLFHLTLPNHDVVQHLVSADGLAWRPLPAALRSGDPGDSDDDQIWTMSVTERDGRYSMLYTALARAEDGHVQRIALAVSDDLVHWTKSERNPVAEADPRWYEANPAASGRVSWRDPKPILVGDTYYAAVCAREGDGPLLRRGCVGLLASPDLETWEPRPPLFAPRRYWDLECPQVFTVGDRYYLTAAIIEDGTQRYWVAPRFEGPYEVPVDGGLLAPLGHYAGRVCRWQGRDLLVCWHEPRPRTRVLAATPGVDWATVRNPFGKFLVPPLALEPRPDGSLARRRFPGWAAYRQGEPTPVRPAPTSLYHRRAVAAGDDWRIDASDGGMDVAATTSEATDLWFEGELTLDAAAGGLAFRLDDEGGGYFVTLRADDADVFLHKWLATRDPHDGRPWISMVELQRGRLPRPLAAGQPLRFGLLVVGSYLEVALDGDVLLATLSAERVAGRVGLWAESGSLTATDVRLAPMRQPGHP